MAIIDDKIVAMSFENSKFQSGVSTTLSSLDKLKAALNFGKAGKGLSDLDAAGKKVQLGHIGSAVEGIQSKLSLLGVAGAAIFASLALKAVSAATSMAKAFTIGPMKAGFAEYSTNLNAVQTIMANTQAAGVKLADVNDALRELNEYSDKTIYNFSQMARNIGTFTAAGVELDTSVAAIKGIANLAALSGSNADQASTAMYQLSQALSAGSVKLMDWNSVVNAGMGGTVFQRALAQTAQKMGTLSEGAVTLKGKMKNVTIEGESFRNSLSAAPGKTGWLTSEVLTSTLSQFTGDLKNAELAAMGFSKAQIQAIQQTAKTAQEAATKVKTITQLIEVAKETAGSGWAQTFQLVFGDFEEAKTLFTGISEAIGEIINNSADARNKVLSDWKSYGGRDLLIDTLAQAFKNLGMIIAPIKDAFREFFPKTTGADLMYLTQQFEALIDKMKPSAETLENVKNTFRGVFALLDIGKEVIFGVIGMFIRLFSAAGGGKGGFLSFTGSIGDMLVALHKWLIAGGRLEAFFDGLEGVLRGPVAILGKLGGAFVALVSSMSKFSPGGFSGKMGAMSGVTSAFTSVIEALSGVWDSFIGSLSGDGNIMQGFTDGLVKFISSIGPALGEATTSMNFDLILAAINTGFFGALVLMIKRFLGPGSIINQIFGKKGILGNISQSFQALTGSMVAMQNNIRADTLQKIAIAIGILTLSIVALSLVDPKKLVSSLTAISVGFGILITAMTALSAAAKGAGFIKMPFIAASLILLAGSIVVLSAAVLMLSMLSWEQLLKGLTGVGVLLGGIVLAVKPLSASAPGMIRAGVGIMAIAASLLVLSVAVQIMGRMDMSTLAKGLGGIAVGLAVMVAAMTKMPLVPLRSTVGLVAMAGALVILSLAVRLMGSMDLLTLGKGLGSIAVGLGIMVVAMKYMPKNMVLQAAALVLVAAALQGIARAVGTMGGMSWQEIAKGMVGLAGSLGILAAALYAMTGTTAGSIALATAASGLALLAPALIALGKQSWEQVLTGLITLAGALTILGVSGLLIGPVVPALLGLGAALLLIGGGLALAGAGIALIGIGLASVVVAAPTAVGILIAALIQLLEAIPRVVTAFALGMLAIVQAFAATAPAFVAALVKIVDALLDGVIKSAPKLAETFVTLMLGALKAIEEHAPRFIQAGFKLLEDLLQGVKNNIGKIVPTVVDIIIRFLTALSANMNKIVTAGTNLLISFLRGISNNLNRIVTSVGSIITTFLNALTNNIGRIIAAGTNLIVKFIQGISNSLGRIIKAGTDLIVNLITGIGNAGGRIVTAAVDAITKFINQVSKSAVKLTDEGAKAVINFLNGVATAINNNAPAMRQAGINVAVAIIDGMTFGLLSQAGRVIGAAADLGKRALGALGKAVKFFSPSKEAWKIGEGFAQGFALGINPTQAEASATAMGQGVITAMTDLFEMNSPSKVMYEIGKFVGQGFANGLKGSGEDVRAAFATLNEKLTEEMRTAREIITEEQAKLEKLRNAKKPDQAEIKATQAVIKENQDILDRVTAGHKTLVKTLKDEKKELIGLTNDYEKLAEKLKGAKAALVDAIRTRNEATKGFTDQYSASPDITGPMVEEIKDAREAIAAEQAKLRALQSDPEDKSKEIESTHAAILAAQARFDTLVAGKVLNAEGTAVDQLATYMNALKLQADAVGAYSSTLDQLRKLGLDDATYQKLLREGTANQQFATQLLSGGRTAVASLNVLDKNLMTVSAKLAVNAAKNLYQAGVDAAEGLVKGLEARQGKIRRVMENIAREMLQALRKELKIKSPSEAFAEVGRYSMEGMAQGFSNSSSIVTTAMDDIAKDAMSAMRKSMRNLSAVITDELDANPVITPILDLTVVRSQSQELGALTDVNQFKTATSFGQASLISLAQTSAQADEVPATAPGTSVVFEQNNYSPDALSEVEIYRQTRNQLSQLKSVLAT